MDIVSHEYLALTTDVGVVELPARTVIEVTGEDRTTLLQNLCTAEVRALAPGLGTEAFFTDVKGKVLAHVFVLCGQQSIVLDTVGNQAAALIAHLDRYIIREDVQLADRSDQCAHLWVCGLHSAARVGEVFGPVPNEEMLSHAGDDILVVRTPMAVPDNFLVRLQTAAKQDAQQRLAVAGTAACGWEACQALRIEAGFPFYGVDISDRNLPQEVGRDAEAISFTKGCYLGQETVARLDALGHVNWMLAGLSGEPSATVGVGGELHADGDVVARVGSSAFSPKHDAPLMLAYVRTGYAKQGLELQTSEGRFVVEYVAGQA